MNSRLLLSFAPRISDTSPFFFFARRLLLFTSDERFPSITRLSVNYCYAGTSLLELEYPVMHSALNFPRLGRKFICQPDLHYNLALSALPTREMLPTYTVASTSQLRWNQSLRLVPRSCERRSIPPDTFCSEFSRPGQLHLHLHFRQFPYFCIGGRCRRATSTGNTPAEELAMDANYGPFLTKGCTGPPHVRAYVATTTPRTGNLSNGLSFIYTARTGYKYQFRAEIRRKTKC